MRLEGKTALVTGGNDGIGLEIARQLSRQGARIVVVARNLQRTDEALAMMQGPAEAIQADLSRADEQDRIVVEVERRWPSLAILVNNAGVQINLPEVGIGAAGMMDALRSEVDLNLTAPITLSLGLMPILARQPEAAIVNISSGLALAPKRTAPVYCATKAGLRTFSQALRYRCEDAATSVMVVDAVMAYVDTDMTRGRDGAKMSAAAAAQAVINGLLNERKEIWVGKTRLLRILHRLSPAIACRILRNG